MGRNLTTKMERKRMRVGEEIALRIDQTRTQDATGTPSR